MLWRQHPNFQEKPLSRKKALVSIDNVAIITKILTNKLSSILQQRGKSAPNSKLMNKKPRNTNA